MHIDLLSLFPGYFTGPFDESIIKRARMAGLLDIHLVDIREYASGPHRQVDDRPYGGGPGMVLMTEPVINAIRDQKKEDGYVIYLSPQGTKLDASHAKRLAEKSHLVLLSGHYEGIDQRIIDLEVDEEISIGDYVLTSGAPAAIVLIDAIARFIPGVLGHPDAATNDSFEKGLEGPHYTRPPLFEGLSVPPVLLSGNHKEIDKWRQDESLKRTREKRPDLL